ncbi:nitroreductase family protein [Spirochaeta isovalerica]|uniref:Nitroreductase n=1 Tax=Spirochaeta isovalerica TaxID=150 RepID=A0A841R8S6_9SPIO|nr:nitroreductase family protein [Spirochaeta isovalerica]MBB6481684.1 nitroreductase [Spirochaeta isovalerica]
MFSELVRNNRTRRIYNRSEVSQSLLKELIEDCRFSASTVNRQEIRYILVNDDQMCRSIFRITNLPTTHKVDEENRPGAFVIMVTKRDMNLPDSFLYYNLGIATANLTLSASSRGYSCVTLLSTNMEKLAALVSLDPDYKAVSVIAVGKSEQAVQTTDIEGGDTSYYKDKGVHTVPKLTADSLIIGKI